MDVELGACRKLNRGCMQDQPCNVPLCAVMGPMLAPRLIESSELETRARIAKLIVLRTCIIHPNNSIENPFQDHHPSREGEVRCCEANPKGQS